MDANYVTYPPENPYNTSKFDPELNLPVTLSILKRDIKFNYTKYFCNNDDGRFNQPAIF